MTAEAAEIKRAVTALRSGCSPSQVVASIAAFYAYPLPVSIPLRAAFGAYNDGYTDGFDHGVRVADRTWADAVATIPAKPKRRWWR